MTHEETIKRIQELEAKIDNPKTPQGEIKTLGYVLSELKRRQKIKSMENKDWREEAREEWHVRTFNMANEVSDYSKVEILIADWWIEKINQALAEEKARVRGEIRDMIIPDENLIAETSEHKFARGLLNAKLTDLLSSLDTTDKNKCPKRDGWLKKWFDRQIFTGMHCGNCGYFSSLDKTKE